jgi:dolichol-phosphate mannosyltransferase
MRNNPPGGEAPPRLQQIRFRALTKGEGRGGINLASDEAFVVPDFELAESLIADGVDSSRVAIRGDSSDPRHYTQSAPKKELVPSVPFHFDMASVVVLPTYNERRNLENMIAAIGRYLVTDVLVVDDNSPDGTGALADQLRERYAWVHVLHRPEKQGLGPAYLAGFQWALARNYDLIIEMDCDFSHPPWDLPRLVHRSRTADLVIGSRYVQGGGTEDWDIRRRWVSRLGNGYVRVFLGREIHDWTGGFRCYRRDLLTRIELERVKAKGYVFQVEMAWRAKQAGARVAEIPIRFTDRLHGQSKLGWSSILEAITHVPPMSFSTSTPAPSGPVTEKR